MAAITAENAGKQDFIPLVRELVRAYQAFAAVDAAGYRDSDLTVPQADVLFTLGNTAGLTFKEIGEQTLITKGTLTGVVDRMEEKGLVRRIAQPDDRRCTRVVLTAKGSRVFQKEFPRQISYIKQRFDRMDKASQKQALESLRTIREIFS
jgi:MarR family 2-MHQ and catechol resistance regulon transcriptional repressor